MLQMLIQSQRTRLISRICTSLLVLIEIEEKPVRVSKPGSAMRDIDALYQVSLIELLPTSAHAINSYFEAAIEDNQLYVKAFFKSEHIASDSNLVLTRVIERQLAKLVGPGIVFHHEQNEQDQKNEHETISRALFVRTDCFHLPLF
jgi:hypothetical protein